MIEGQRNGTMPATDLNPRVLTYTTLGGDVLDLSGKRGDIVARPAKPGGARLVVSKNSLDRWTPSEKYQSAGRARAAALAG